MSLSSYFHFKIMYISKDFIVSVSSFSPEVVMHFGPDIHLAIDNTDFLFSSSSFFFYIHCFSPTSGIPRKLIFKGTQILINSCLKKYGIWTRLLKRTIKYIIKWTTYHSPALKTSYCLYRRKNRSPISKKALLCTIYCLDCRKVQ